MSDRNNGTVGLQNDGNTCYLNASLQVLLHTTPLVEFFLSGAYEGHINHSNLEGYNGKFATAFAKLIHEFWTTSRRSLITGTTSHLGDLRSIIASKHPEFNGNQQHDAHEFLLRQNSANPSLSETPSSETLADAHWQHHLLSSRSVIDVLFTGQLRSSLSCNGRYNHTRCGNSTVQAEPFVCLSVPIPQAAGSVTLVLNKCLEEFSASERRERRDCSKCNRKVDVTGSLSLLYPPPYMIIHLKRFQFKGGDITKLDCLVEFPLFNFNPLCPEKGNHCYDLYGVIHHDGSVTSGHYWSTVRVAGSWPAPTSFTEKQWYNFNDHLVTEVKSVKEIVVSTAYLLFYVRKDMQQINFSQFLNVVSTRLNLSEAEKSSLAASCPNADVTIDRHLSRPVGVEFTLQELANLVRHKIELCGDVVYNIMPAWKTYRRYPYDYSSSKLYPDDKTNPPLMRFNVRFRELFEMKEKNRTDKTKSFPEIYANDLDNLILNGLVESYRRFMVYSLFVEKLRVLKFSCRYTSALLGKLMEYDLGDHTLGDWSLKNGNLAMVSQHLKKCMEEIKSISANADQIALPNYEWLSVFMEKIDPFDELVFLDKEGLTDAEEMVHGLLLKVAREQSIVVHICNRILDTLKKFPEKLLPFKLALNVGQDERQTQVLKSCSLMLKSYDRLVEQCSRLPFHQRDQFADEIAKLKVYLAQVQVDMEANKRCSVPVHHAPLESSWLKFMDSLKLQYYFHNNPSIKSASPQQYRNAFQKAISSMVSKLDSGSDEKKRWVFFLTPNGTFETCTETECGYLSPLVFAILVGWNKYINSPVGLNKPAFGFLVEPKLAKQDKAWMPMIYSSHNLSEGEIDFLIFHFPQEYVKALEDTNKERCYAELSDGGKKYPAPKNVGPARQSKAVKDEAVTFIDDLIKRPANAAYRQQSYKRNEIYMLLCLALLRCGDCSYYIGALLVDPSGVILHYAVNTVPDPSCQTKHAETNVFWDYRDKKLPAGFMLFSSLKSCKQCSGVMFNALSTFDGSVFYEFMDSGPYALTTCISSREELLPLYLDKRRVLRRYKKGMLRGSAGDCQRLRRRTFKKAKVVLKSIVDKRDKSEEEGKVVNHIRTFVSSSTDGRLCALKRFLFK